MKRVVKLVGLGLLVLLLGAVSVLAFKGLPPPPAITADGVPRVPWKRTWEMISGVKSWQAVTSFAAWVPSRQEILVASGTTGRVQRLAAPGAKLEPIAGLPAEAYNLVLGRSAERDSFVFARDEGGSELYRLHRYDWATGTAQVLTATPARGTICCFEPGGERVAYASTERNGEDFDLYLMDPSDPASAERVLEADGEYWPLSWSPDGRYIALIRYLSHAQNALFLLDVKTGSLERLLADWGDSGAFLSVEWSRDGNSLFFTSDHRAEFHGMRRYELATGAVTVLAEDIAWDVIDLEPTPDGTRIAFLANEDSVPRLCVLDLASGTWRPVEDAPLGFIRAQLAFGEGLRMHPLHARVALDVRPPSGATSVYSYDLDASEWTRWTQPAPDDADLPPVEIVRYPTFDLVDGEPRRIPAAVFRPAASFEPPHPVLIEIHGGPAMQAGPVLPRPFAGIPAVGVAVIRPNVRGSSGYGRSYLELDDGRGREGAVRDIGALLDWIAAQPDLDADRVAVMGASYGGYMALASLTHYSGRLRCGIDMFGFSNLPTFLEASEEHHFPDAQRAEYGDERDPEMRAFLKSISPLRHAERITVPLMIYQGANDVRIKAEESRRMVERIRATGGTVSYIEAADEGHGLSRPLNLLYVGAAYAEFLDECLFG